MGNPFFFLCIAVTVLSSSLTFGLFEDQAGEYDWKIESIGAIQQSFIENERTIVSTAQSVIASINNNDGGLKWRISLPRGTIVHQIISGKAPSGSVDIFSLSSIRSTSQGASGSDHQYTLSSWSSDSGTLRWQLPLGLKKLGLTDLVYDSSRFLLTCLCGNTIDTATVRGYLLWHWNPALSDDSQLVGNTKNGKQLVLTQLLPRVENFQSNTDNQSRTRIAVGCFSDIATEESEQDARRYSSPSSYISFTSGNSENSESEAKCGNTAVISVILPTKLKISAVGGEVAPTINVKVFHPLSDVSVSSLRATMSTYENAPYAQSDIIFGTSVSTDRKPKVFVLSLSNESVYSEEIPSAAVSIPTRGASYLIASENHGFTPVLVFCDSLACSSFYITDKSEDRVGVLSECVGVRSILGFERIPFGGSLGAAISCTEIPDKKMQKSKNENENENEKVCVNKDQCGVVESENIIRVRSSRIVQNGVQSNFNFVLTEQPLISPLLFVSISSKGDRHTVLAVQSNLLTTFYTGVSTFNVGTNAVKVWSREECLSHVKQTVIADDARNHVHVDGVDDVAPSFTERLLLQYEELKQTISSLEISLNALPQVLYEHSVTGFGMFPSTSTSNSPRLEVEVGLGIDILARKRRQLKKGILSNKVNLSKARLFGFNKIAVCFSSRQANIGGETVLESEEPMILKSDKLRFSDAGLRLIGLDLLTGDVIWTLDPTLESGRKISLGSEQCEIENSEECNGVLFAKIVTLHSSPQGSEISLLVSLVSGSTYVWNIDVATGSVSQEHSKQLPDKYEGHLVGIMSMQRSGEVSKGTSQFLLLKSTEVGAVAASLFPSTHTTSTATSNFNSNSTISGTYTHKLDRKTGKLSTFSISPDGKGSPVASALFPGPLSSVSYPYFDDVIDTRYTVIGDRSLLMKYVNPHTVLITYFSGSSSESSESASNDDGRVLEAALVDTISCKILYRIELSKTATLPVNSLIVENHIIITYWNAKAKRTELSSTALYEGMVDVFGLSPLSYFSALPQQIRDADLSSFSSPNPLGIQRTYVIPRAVTSLHHTVTSRGMAHKNILMGLSGGQLFSLDHRLLHPRRPVGPPTIGEKEEGLVQYNAFIPIIPQHAVTMDTRVAGECLKIVTAPVRLESTSLVLVYGGHDLFFSRLRPSEGFDVLASDFNYPLLIFLLVVLAGCVLALKRAHAEKSLKQSWA